MKESGKFKQNKLLEVEDKCKILVQRIQNLEKQKLDENEFMNLFNLEINQQS